MIIIKDIDMIDILFEEIPTPTIYKYLIYLGLILNQ